MGEGGCVLQHSYRFQSCKHYWTSWLMFGDSLVSSFLQTRDRSTMVSMNGLNLWYQLLPSRTSAQSGFLSVLTRNMDQWNASECSGLTKNRKTFLKVDAAGAPPRFPLPSSFPSPILQLWVLTANYSQVPFLWGMALGQWVPPHLEGYFLPHPWAAGWVHRVESLPQNSTLWCDSCPRFLRGPGWH